MKEAFLNMNAMEYLIVAIAIVAGWILHCIKAASDRHKANKIDEDGAKLIERMSDYDLMEAVVKREITLPKRFKALLRNVATEIENADDVESAVHFCRVLGGVKADIDEERENIKFVSGD